MSRKAAAALVAVGTVALTACSSTTFQSTWSAPDAGQLKLDPGTKVLAMVVSPDEAKRRGMEAALVSELNTVGLEGVPAYSVVPADAAQDKDKAAPFVKKSGAAYAIVVQITGKSKEISSTPTMMGAGMWGAPGGFYGARWGWGYGWGGGAEITTDTLVSVQTLLYDLGNDKLAWAGQSQTMNPTKAQSFMRDILKGVGSELRKAGLIGPAKG